MLLSQLLWPTLKLKLPLERGSFHKTGSFLGGATRPEKNKEKQGCELKKVENLQQADGTVLHYAI